VGQAIEEQTMSEAHPTAMEPGESHGGSPARLHPSARLAAIVRPLHGGVYEAHLRRLKAERAAILDASVNSNPYGPPPEVHEALTHALDGAVLARYPDPEATLLLEVLAAHLGMDVELLLAGNGSAEIFWSLALAYLDPGDEALVVGPAFGEYVVASQVAGARVRAARPPERPELGWEREALLAAVRAAGRPKLIWLANPANPTGQYLPRETIEALLASFAGLLVLDEAYIGFVADAWNSLSLTISRRVALVRSLTKDYALAGLRLGYVVAHPDMLASLRRVRVPWSVNALAQVAGCAALQSGSFLAESRQRLLEDGSALRRALTSAGWACAPTETHFFLAEAPPAWPSAAAAQEALLRRGLMVRDCASFGLPRHIRVATRRPEENQRIVRLVAAIAPTTLDAAAAEAAEEGR
jgi:histidinol-phosphate aminotransferase